MKVAKLFPYVLLVAAGALSIPTMVSAFSEEPTSPVFVVLSSSFLLLAIISLAYSHTTGEEPDISKT